MTDRINRARNLTLDDETLVVLTITRKRGGRGRVTVVANYDPDEVLGVLIQAREQREPPEPSSN